MNMFFLSVGALVGAPLRYVLGEWFKAKFTERIWPLAMVIVNMLGSFGLGVFATFIFFHEVSSSTQLLIATGFFGSFTTFSTFSVEAFLFLKERRYRFMAVYLFLSIVGSVFSFAVGYWLFI
ncbi:fluoride efflux transporter CrcB [Alkalihalobacillus pseudalcaliphilus]|uniref:fluoride efflux transporter CrcB n=1 Tax=Alkalihalobacillus pseudalcaliphilus TaxID=79884 RepID=UPI00064D836F|nr:fluoride efflux transporter CrcB [Alkalihalobacillus pseudalcaliphilus]KMK74714.1 hypothetical protein AB990_19715 [Alkalihalobacillus pseudalcaliphilus]